MPLKYEITNIDELPEQLRPMYVERGGKYHLDIEGVDDLGALMRAKGHEAKARAKAEAAAEAAAAKIEELLAERDDMLRGAIPKADVDRLEQSHREKFEREIAKRDEAIAKRDAAIRREILESKAAALAAKLSDSPRVLLPHITGRLAVELDSEGAPSLRVLDSTGAPSALSLADLEREFSESPDFAGVVRGTKASGAGARAGSTAGGGIPAGLDFSRASPAEMVAAIESQYSG